MKTDSLHIVHIPRRFLKEEWGGTETTVLELSKGLQAVGHDVQIVCPSILTKRRAEEMDGVSVTRTRYFYPYLGLSKTSRALLDKKGGNLFSFHLFWLLRRLPKLDILHLHTGKRLGGICRVVARLRNIPYVISLHGGIFDMPHSEEESFTQPTKKTIEWGKILGWLVGSRNVLEDADAIICVGESEREKIRKKFPNKRVYYLPNGVNPEQFAEGNGQRFRKAHGILKDEVLITTVGRIDPQKNQRFVVELLPNILTKFPRTKLLLIGHVTNESYKESILQTAKQLGVEDRVQIICGLAPDSTDLVDAYHASDLFLLPSVHEPFGIVILEAWAAGLPVIASRVGGIPAFVEDGKDGILFDSNNPDDLLAKLTQTLDQPNRMKELAAQGKSKAQSQYSWKAVTGQLEQIYTEILSERTFSK